MRMRAWLRPVRIAQAETSEGEGSAAKNHAARRAFMVRRIARFVLAILLALTCLSASAPAQLPPPTPPPPATLWRFMGIPQAYRYVRDNGSNRNGNRPQAERKPPLKAIADPKNLESKDASIKKAAEVKQAEDDKKQKIKAVKYLAKIGCGCYNRDGSITDALLKSMDDCTEEVRLATVQAISEAAAGEFCVNCKNKSCCSEELSNKLYEIAYEKDENGCWLEPSERVRLAAAEALRTCCENCNNEQMIFEEGPPPAATGGEVPAIVPESGGERPAIIIPSPGGTINPTPAIPLQNPVVPVPVPVPVIPVPVPVPVAPPTFRTIPGALPPAAQPIAPPASGAASPTHSSRRTAMLQQAVQPKTIEAAPAVASSHPTKSVAAITVSAPADANALRSRDSVPELSAHWNSVETKQSVFFKAPPSASSPIDGKAVLAHEATENLAPIVTKDRLVRLPPVDGPVTPAAAEMPLPAPPIPAAPQVISVSSTRSAPAAQREEKAPPRPVRPVSKAKPAVSVKPVEGAESPPAKATAKRVAPGAKYGAGVVRSVHLKDGIALLEFESDSELPPGSIVRAYHEFALSGKTAVCDLQVVRGENGTAAAVARSGSQLTHLSVGDHAIVLQ
jgi:hypothetical protein